MLRDRSRIIGAIVGYHEATIFLSKLRTYPANAGKIPELSLWAGTKTATLGYSFEATCGRSLSKLAMTSIKNTAAATAPIPDRSTDKAIKMNCAIDIISYPLELCPSSYLATWLRRGHCETLIKFSEKITILGCNVIPGECNSPFCASRNAFG